MATSKKGGKKTAGKTKVKPKASKKAKPKVSKKAKPKAVKKAKKAPAKAKVKPKTKAKARAKVIKKATPKAPAKNKVKAPAKKKEVTVAIPEKKIIKEVAKPSRGLTRGEAPASKTTLDQLYIINESNDSITLEVNAGDKGQTSDMTIKLDDKFIAKEIAGDFDEMPLGTNNELSGKKLSIVATITATSDDTKLTSLTIHVRGGFRPETYSLSKEVERKGQSVDYLSLIEFFKPD